MRLSEYKVVAGLAVSDMDRGREFYEGRLGLSVAIDSGDNVAYRCAEGSVLHVYLSPDRAGGSAATLASWYVDDVEGVVDELTKRVSLSSTTMKGRSSRTRRASLRSTRTPRSPTSETQMATPSRSPQSHVRKTFPSLPEPLFTQVRGRGLLRTSARVNLCAKAGNGGGLVGRKRPSPTSSIRHNGFYRLQNNGSRV
jgi:hypothetical protein